MCTTTAAAFDFSSRSSASTRSWSLRIRPSMVTRAIEPALVNVPRAPGEASVPITAIAPMAMITASTRQNVSLRRILRRSTITSESSDIEILLKTKPACFARIAQISGYPVQSIAVQYEENKAPEASTFVMAGVVPAIPLFDERGKKDGEARDKRGHDD